MHQTNLFVGNSKLPSFVIAAHAAEQDSKYGPTYTKQQHSVAELLMQKVQAAYPDCRIYQNYRKKFIAIKVHNPGRHNVAGMQKLKAFCMSFDVEKVDTPGAVIYRLLKNS